MTKSLSPAPSALRASLCGRPGQIAPTSPAGTRPRDAPQGCDIHFARFDFRVGGSFHSRISNPSFGDCWCLGTYLEIVPPERLVYTMALADAAGHLIAAKEAGHDPEWPAETTVTLTLTEQADGSTLLKLHQNVKESIARRTGAYPSWLSMFDRLAEDLANL